MTAVHGIARGTSCAFYPQLHPWLHIPSFRQACGDWAATAVIIICAIICSGVFVLAVIRQKHNIFPPSTLKALRHVSALKGLSYVAASTETETPGDRVVSLLYVFFLQLTTASIDLIHTYTSASLTVEKTLVLHKNWNTDIFGHSWLIKDIYI